MSGIDGTPPALRARAIFVPRQAVEELTDSDCSLGDVDAGDSANNGDVGQYTGDVERDCVNIGDVGYAAGDGAYTGDVGQYTGDVERDCAYIGDVGYAGDGGYTAGDVGQYTGDAPNIGGDDERCSSIILSS